MKFHSVFAFALSFTALTACQPTDGFLPRFTDEPVSAPSGSDLSGMMCAGDPALSERMAEAINVAREGEGKTLLETDGTLSSIAQSHACDIAAIGHASVAGSDGSNVVDRARTAGYSSCGVTQLVSVDDSPEGIVGGWMNSVPHRTELLSQLNEEIGVGVTRGSDGRMWWSVVMGASCG